MDTLKLGQLITTEQRRDATHIAVAPVVADHSLDPGTHVGIRSNGNAGKEIKTIGIVDPFLREKVKRGDKFWLFLYPGSITSLNHHWTHPAFTDIVEEDVQDDKSFSKKWMKDWAVRHMGEDYYGEGRLSEEVSYDRAIEAGHNLSVGPYESARNYIDNEWWYHWQKITGLKKPDDAYFSCGC